MSITACIVYGVIAGLVAVVAATRFEHERKNSTKQADREATLKPGLDGVVVGICWPLVLFLFIVFGIIYAFATAGRFFDSLIER